MSVCVSTQVFLSTYMSGECHQLWSTLPICKASRQPEHQDHLAYEVPGNVNQI